VVTNYEDDASCAEDSPPHMSVAATNETVSGAWFEHVIRILPTKDEVRGSTSRFWWLHGFVTDNASNPETFDLIIVGSGSGNSIPEYLGAWKIAMVERGTFGGTCLNVGCIPSKMFVLPADKAVEARTSAKLGIDTQFNSADFVAIRDRVFGRIDEISAGGRDYRANGNPNVTLIEGTARFASSKVLDVEGRVISAPHILLAAGARPVVPPIPGLVETGFHTSDSIMRLDGLPEHLGIIGGGFVAVEMGHVFSGLGSKVTLMNRSNTLLRGFDGDIAARFTEVFGQRVDLHLGHVPTHVARLDDGRISITCAGEEVVVNELLVATGREPNSDLLDVDAAGIECHRHGTVKVDDTMATNVDGIWAIGDVANSYQLKHVANAEAAVAFWNIAHPDDIRHQSYKAIPGAVFSYPQVASVGMTEEQAIDAGLPIKVGRRDYAGTAYGWALVDDTSFAKVIVNTETGMFVGAHIIGPQAATLIQPIIQAMELDTPAEIMARSVFYIHPALTEVVENAILDALA
jgi:mycothione reductase